MRKNISMLEEKFGGDVYFKYLTNSNRVFLTVKMCVAEVLCRMHSICMCWVVGWVGLGSGISD